jgi:cleavage and polyadenylation specificity factor subunit 2
LNLNVPLTGVELDIFQQKLHLMQEKASIAQAALVCNQQLLEANDGADFSDSDSDAKNEEDIKCALGLDTESTRTDGTGWVHTIDICNGRYATGGPHKLRAQHQLLELPVH